MYCILHLYNLPLDSKTYSDTKYFDLVSDNITSHIFIDL